MAFKVENGKVYEIKEVNLAEFEKEIMQTVNYIKQYQENNKPYINAIANKQAELKAFEEKINKEIADYQAVVDENTKKIEEAKLSIMDKKDVITQLYPEANRFLEF